MNFLLKIGPYRLAADPRHKYDQVVKLLRKEIDPFFSRRLCPERLPAALISILSRADRVYHSPARRSRGTLAWLKEKGILPAKAKTMAAPFLSEIGFDPCPDLPYLVYRQEGSRAVRRIFLDRLAADQLQESHKKIQRRFETVVKIIQNHPQKKIIFISHTFFLRLFLAWRADRRLFQKPENLRRLFQPGRRILDFFALRPVGL